MNTSEKPAPFAFSLVLAMGLMLSPESLIILGNSMGGAGSLFLVFIISSMVVYLFTALSYAKIHSLYAGPEGESRVIKEALGVIPAIVLPICSRVVFTLCVATGILATAGYVFNEVFVYWFPNLGFSFCLLGFLLVLNLLNQRISRVVQVVFVTVAIFGLVVISTVGLLELGNLSKVGESTGTSSFSVARVALLSLMLFVGFDLAGLAGNSEDKNPAQLVRSMVVGIVLVGVVFIIWGLVSFVYVSPERLSETTVPHLITARIILGETGRIIMGIVVVAGTCSAVNVLLIAVSKMIAGMAVQGFLPSFFGFARDRAPIPLIILATGIAAMLALGMAGAPALEVYMRAGLLFWLLNYAVVNLSVLIMGRRMHDRSTLLQIPGYPATIIISILAFLGGFAGLMWSDSESVLLLKFMLSILVLVSLLSLVWIVLGRGKGPADPRMT